MVYIALALLFLAFPSEAFQRNIMMMAAKPTNSKISNENANAVVSIYKNEFKKVRAGGDYDLSDAQLFDKFDNLVKLVKDDKIALQIVKNSPDVLTISTQRVNANFNVYQGKFGFEESVGLITRNPLILSVPTTGYGSAEVAGKDAIAISYVINATRPIGKPLLMLLFLALCKPFVAPYLGL